MESIELFTGAGGLALGVSRAGFHTRAVIERDAHACQTLRYNQSMGHPHVRNWSIHERDVTSVDYAALAGRADLVAGGPPCQPFSMGGKHRAHEDSRDMFPEAARAVLELRPKAFIFENVKGLCRQSFATYFNFILLRLSYPELTRKTGEDWRAHQARLERHHTRNRARGLHYKVVFRLLNAADYGVPQRRERVFFVGFRSDVYQGWSFPDPTHAQDALLADQWVIGGYWERHRVPRKERGAAPDARALARIRERAAAKPTLAPWRTVRDALAGLPEPAARGSESVPNHVFMPGARAYVGHTGSPLDAPAKALKAGVHGVPGGENMIALPDGSVRYFTVREAARVQSFPDSYVLCGSWTESMRQLGNAVPVTLAERVAASVRACLDFETARTRSRRRGDVCAGVAPITR